MKWTRQHAQAGVAALIALAVGTWFVMATEWVDVELPPELRGPAKTDPMYTFKAFTTAMGVELSTPDNLDRLPPPGATLVLSSWFWDLFPERNDALKRWVRAGGHLVVPSFEYNDETLAWTGIVSTSQLARAPARPASAASAASAADDDDEDDDESAADKPHDSPGSTRGDTHESAAPPRPAPPPVRPSPGMRRDASMLPPNLRPSSCPKFVEPATVAPAYGRHRSFTTCSGTASTLASPAPALWAVDNSRGHVVLRVPLGKGSVTASNLRLPIYGTSLLDNDEALLLSAALRLERGQRLWLVTDEKRAPLLATLWKHGAPAIVLGAVALVLALWRAGVRFGPRIAPVPTARRSVGEQIRGTSAFIAHHGGRALHQAQLRALDACARARVPGYDALIVGERAAVLAPLAGIDAHTLARAMNPELSKHLPSALALLETTRRRLLLNSKTPTRTPHAA